MSEAEKQLLAAMLHMGVDQGLPLIEKDLVAKIPGVYGAVVSEIMAVAMPKIEAAIDAVIKEKLGY